MTYCTDYMYTETDIESPVTELLKKVVTLKIQTLDQEQLYEILLALKTNKVTNQPIC